MINQAIWFALNGLLQSSFSLAIFTKSAVEQLRVRMLNQHDDFQTLCCCREIHIFLHVCSAQMKCLIQQQQGLSAQPAVGDTAPQSPTLCLPPPWVIQGHTHKCHSFWKELGCLKCDLDLRKYDNWLRAECFDPSDFDVRVLFPVPGHAHQRQNFPLFILVLSSQKSAFSLKLDSCCHLPACCRKRLSRFSSSGLHWRAGSMKRQPERYKG